MLADRKSVCSERSWHSWSVSRGKVQRLHLREEVSGADITL